LMMQKALGAVSEQVQNLLVHGRIGTGCYFL
jgi:hypothetical protein